MLPNLTYINIVLTLIYFTCSILYFKRVISWISSNIFFFSHSYFFNIIFLGNSYVDTTNKTFIFSQFLILLFLIGLFIGSAANCIIPKRKILYQYIKSRKTYIKIKNEWILAIILLYILNVWVTGQINPLDQLFIGFRNSLTNFYSKGAGYIAIPIKSLCFILSTLFIGKLIYRKKLLYGFIVLICYLTIAIGTGSRGYILFILIAYLLILLYRYHVKFYYKFLIVISIVAFSPILLSIRGWYKITVENILSSYEFFFTALSFRGDTIIALNDMLEYLKKLPFNYHFYSIYTLLFKPFPSYILSIKPKNIELILNESIYGYNDVTPYSTSFGGIGEWYLNFDVVGVLIYGILVGFFLFYFEKKITQSIKLNSLKGPLILSIIPLYNIEHIGISSTTVSYLLVFLLLTIFLAQTLRIKYSRQRIADG